MNVILAQTLALAAHARARRLDARLGGDATYWQRHSTFQYVRTLKFKKRIGRFFWKSEIDVASTPPGWMAALPVDAEVSFVSFGASIALPAHIASALSGGTQEGISVQNSESKSLWLPTWEVVSRYPDTKIWAVKYVAKQSRGPKSPQPIEKARVNLASALSQIAEFTKSDSNLSGWTETFVKAMKTLEASEPIAPYHPDILPPAGYLLPARQLLAASVTAFVFGGMGSWNDVGLRDHNLQGRYELLTRQLYARMMDGFDSAVNAGIVP